MDTYASTLPDNYYYPSLSKQVLNLLTKGESVLVGGIYGCGIHTFLNVFSLQASQSKSFEHVSFFSSGDFSINEIGKINQLPGDKLVIIHSFEQLSDKSQLLDKLQQFSQPKKDLVYLVITDHTIVTRAEEYRGISSPVFGQRMVITPFDPEQTRQLVEINAQF